MKRGPLVVGAKEGRDPRPAIRASRRQESAVAKDLRGRVQSNSGAKWDKKGDVVTETLVVEAKRTDFASYSLKLDEWLKVKYEAIQANKLPVMAVEIKKERLAVLSWNDYLALLERNNA